MNDVVLSSFLALKALVASVGGAAPLLQIAPTERVPTILTGKVVELGSAKRVAVATSHITQNASIAH